MQLEERRVLLSRAAEAERSLQQCLAEAEADAATWRTAAQHGLSQGEVWHCRNTSSCIFRWCLALRNVKNVLMNGIRPALACQ